MPRFRFRVEAAADSRGSSAHVGALRKLQTAAELSRCARPFARRTGRRQAVSRPQPVLAPHYGQQVLPAEAERAVVAQVLSAEEVGEGLLELHRSLAEQLAGVQ